LPIVVYEIFAFIMPGLNPKERSWVWFMIPLATLFFAGGVLFAYFFMLPTALPFLLNFMGITTAPRPSTYFGFVLNLLFWVGLAFELPLIVFLLARLGLITAKQLLKQWRIAIIVIAILSALITPTPDPVNMALMMLPLFTLYLISIFFAVIAGRSRMKAQEEYEGSEPLETPGTE
jgi:sec-independent protein translocase protein TatC